MKNNEVWVVEMRGSSGRWVSTTAAALTAQQAKDEHTKWKIRNPDDEFRIVKYRRIDKDTRDD